MNKKDLLAKIAIWERDLAEAEFYGWTDSVAECADTLARLYALLAKL